MKEYIESLKKIAIKSLQDMYYSDEHLFCYKLEQNGQGILVKKDFSIRYTIITLLGLIKWESEGNKSPIDIQSVFKKLSDDINKIDNVGDFGLLLWLSAFISDSDHLKIIGKIDYSELKRKYKDAHLSMTTELSWLLTGLTYCARNKQKNETLEKLSHQAFNDLILNYRKKSLFGHQSNNSIKGVFRHRIGSFADQVYPIYGLSVFSETYNNKEALQIAQKCADKICELQGSLGQWWWHYDAVDGRAIGHYPVYSVHQYGMAPMALLSLQKIGNKNFHDQIKISLEWLKGKNELESEMVSVDRNIIWRSIYAPKYNLYYDELLSFLFGMRSMDIKNLKILCESRPYCLGWLLYALSNNTIN
jgi:hypothetical protein